MLSGKVGREFVRMEVVLELDPAGGISGSVDSEGSSGAMEDVDGTAPLARDCVECCACQVL